MQKLRFAIFSIGLSISLASCNEPKCENTNVIFNSGNPETQEYKNELIRQVGLNKSYELSYWFDRYEVKNEKEYVWVNIHGKEFCAKAKLRVTDWEKLDGIKRTQGKGYHGAELTGLRFSIKIDSMNTELIFKDLTAIRD